MAHILSRELCSYLSSLAAQYETADFLKTDPSQFMHRYTDEAETELVAFIASALSFGRREQILLHIEKILSFSAPSPYLWIKEGAYTSVFRDSTDSFYRMYSYSDMRILFDVLRAIINQSGSLGNYIKSLYAKRSDNTKHLSLFITEAFPLQCKLVPHGKNCALKRVQMFLRWMVRDNSPVDLGLWSTWANKQDLLMPLDTHVMHQSTMLGLIPLSKNGKVLAPTFTCAKNLTETLKQVFYDDPVRADFALFGEGVSAIR